jgi:hypothetical protein
VALIVINILILAQIKRKRKMFTGGHNNTIGELDSSVLTATKAERKRLVMIVLIGVNYILGHSLNVAWRIIDNFIIIHASGPYWVCLSFAAYTLVAISYATPFFFYYFFNMGFKESANCVLKYVFYPLWLVLVKVGALNSRGKGSKTESPGANTTTFTARIG